MSPDSSRLLVHPPVDTRGAGSHGDGLTHAYRIRRRVFTLIMPLSTVRDIVMLEFIHGSVTDLALNDTETPRINDTWGFAIPRDVLAVVPGIPLGIHTFRYRHAADLLCRSHATVGVLHATRE